MSATNPCIGSGCVYGLAASKHTISRRVVYDNFFLDPNAKYTKDGAEYYHAEAFMNGIDSKDDPSLLDNNGIPVPVYANVTYEKRYIALYRMPSPIRPLCIGFEVLKALDKPIKDPFVSVPNLTKFRHYHQVQLVEGGDIFHVVTKKDK